MTHSKLSPNPARPSAQWIFRGSFTKFTILMHLSPSSVLQSSTKGQTKKVRNQQVNVKTGVAENTASSLRSEWRPHKSDIWLLLVRRIETWLRMNSNVESCLLHEQHSVIKNLLMQVYGYCLMDQFSNWSRNIYFFKFWIWMSGYNLKNYLSVQVYMK